MLLFSYNLGVNSDSSHPEISFVNSKILIVGNILYISVLLFSITSVLHAQHFLTLHNYVAFYKKKKKKNMTKQLCIPNNS